MNYDVLFIYISVIIYYASVQGHTMLLHVDNGDFAEVAVTPHVETHAHRIAVTEVDFGHH